MGLAWGHRKDFLSKKAFLYLAQELLRLGLGPLRDGRFPRVFQDYRTVDRDGGLGFFCGHRGPRFFYPNTSIFQLAPREIAGNERGHGGHARGGQGPG